MEKKKILTISDHPLIPSGVGLQTRYVIEGLLETGKYKFVSLGAAMKHPDYRPQNVFPEKYHGDWIIHPIDGYGDRQKMRQFLVAEKPDLLLIVTDPRFYIWLFEMEDEIHKVCPIAYWHVWDNDPSPQYNDAYYASVDTLVPLSLKTYGLLQDLQKTGHYRPGDIKFIPHAIPPEQFKPLPEAEVMKKRIDKFGPHANKRFISFFNSRNARRKMTGDVIGSFAQFADEVGHQNVALFMQTQPFDPEGQDLVAVAKRFKVDDCIIMSEQRIPPEEMNFFYNACDVTVNLSNNEGFGLSGLESLMAGTPVMLHMTGGLQFQIGNWWEELKDFSDQEKLTDIQRDRWHRKEGKWWGVPIFPTSRSCTGSQPIPYIYDDRFHYDDVVKGYHKLYNMTRAERKNLGLEAREWAIKNFNMKFMIDEWERTVEQTISNFKSGKPVKFVTL
jgi:glycosyltransferase involved in cell wall biosynthesis